MQLSYLKLSDLFGEVFNALFILLAYCIYFLYGIADLHGAGGHFVHTFGDNAGKLVELLHFLRHVFAAAQHFRRTVVHLIGYHVDVADGGEYLAAAVFLFTHSLHQVLTCSESAKIALNFSYALRLFLSFNS